MNRYGNLSGGAQASVAPSYDFIRSPPRVMDTTGDFDGDGRTDFIATTPTGSFWYYSTGTCTWNAATGAVVTRTTFEGAAAVPAARLVREYSSAAARWQARQAHRVSARTSIRLS